MLVTSSTTEIVFLSSDILQCRWTSWQNLVAASHNSSHPLSFEAEQMMQQELQNDYQIHFKVHRVHWRKTRARHLSFITLRTYNWNWSRVLAHLDTFGSVLLGHWVNSSYWVLSQTVDWVQIRTLHLSHIVILKLFLCWPVFSGAAAPVQTAAGFPPGFFSPDPCYRGASPLQDAATTGLHAGGSMWITATIRGLSVGFLTVGVYFFKGLTML